MGLAGRGRAVLGSDPCKGFLLMVVQGYTGWNILQINTIKIIDLFLEEWKIKGRGRGRVGGGEREGGWEGGKGKRRLGDPNLSARDIYTPPLKLNEERFPGFLVYELTR